MPFRRVPRLLFPKRSGFSKARPVRALDLVLAKEQIGQSVAVAEFLTTIRIFWINRRKQAELITR